MRLSQEHRRSVSPLPQMGTNGKDVQASWTFTGTMSLTARRPTAITLHKQTPVARQAAHNAPFEREGSLRSVAESECLNQEINSPAAGRLGFGRKEGAR